LTVGRLLIVRRRGPLAPLLIGQCLCAVFSQARGAWIGLGVGLLALGLTWASVTHNKKLAAVTLVAGLLAVGFVGLLNLPNGPVAALARQPGLARLAKLTNTREGSTAARLTIWQATLPLVAQRPWLGYGPETMRTVFARVYPPQLVYYQGRQVAVDRSHNLWLDLALSAGGAGLAAFLALLVGFCWLARRGLAGASDRWEATRWTALIAAVIGHLADVQFGFDSVASMTVFWLILALAATAPLPAAVAGERPEPAPQRSAWLPYIAPALLVLALIGLVCVRPLLADHAAWNSRQTIHAAQARQAEAERSVRLWPLEPEYRIGLAATYLDNGAPLAAEAQLAAADRLSPDDPQIWVAFGNLYAVWGEREPARFAQAEAAYRRGLALAPNVVAVHTALGLALVGQGRLHEGLIELERAVALDATDGVAYWRLAELYNMLGRPYDADQARKEAEILGR
jgi:Tfp pilus assembly protein PilF